ncbi:restriction endonuclease subunit S [uncultured Alistipes sp.]|uniref:restriction endonuclease subunit S n=5 Tax=uncultured Alistipes sp. TaxID=538949 RepID=UPI0025A3A87E|nr:restriction endonuclease subunit S [uncultured Alistipes sp.]
MPFEIPESWVWTTIGDISLSILYGVSESAKSEGKYKLLRITDIQNNKVNWDTVPYSDFEDNVQNYILEEGDILFARTGATVGKSYLVNKISISSIYASYLIRVKSSKLVLPAYVKFFFESGFYWEQISMNAVGVGQPNVNGTSLANLRIPLPPYNEQIRIVKESTNWLKRNDILDNDIVELGNAIEHIKSKILDLAIHGKLVPQDPNDEPAIDLLRRINPDFKPCDNAHYKNLPSGWSICRLEDIVDYEQPQAYIVDSTNYSEDYTTPVLTAGKSFIIGYTNETDGIFDNLPVIIFDDFTTDSRFVDFPFKVKSSAMKILRVKKEIDIRYVGFYMIITRLVGDTHKRYWISEYSKLPIPIPPKAEQERIVQTVTDLLGKLDNIIAEL